MKKILIYLSCIMIVVLLGLRKVILVQFVDLKLNK